MGASGIGALSAAIYMASRKSVLGLGKIVPVFSVVFGLGLILFSLSHSFPLSVVLIAITGFGMIMQMTSSNTILQTVVDDDKRGRVMSFYTMAFMGTAPFGSLMAGAMANAIGGPATLVIGGSACILGALIFARKRKELQKIIQQVYIKKGIIPQPNIDTTTDPLSS
jgi:MFS family permease